jgi:3'-phosphoadenosine 5'-phosphosulfate sulfotransferase (PAPS reductase)/FAD synthetase
MGERIVCRFSAGAASAVATALILKAHPDALITRVRMGGEHEDNDRFAAECAGWWGRDIITRQNDRYADHMDVWEKERFIMSRQGASCTGRLKREPWYDFDLPDDVLVIGYTAEEAGRAESLRRMMFEKSRDQLVFPLIEAGLTKSDCLAIIDRRGIKLPAMYELGFKNNNCLGCCKGGMGYWNKIRDVFPDRFERAARIQRELGDGAAFWVRDGRKIMLDELDPKAGHYPTENEIECSIFCGMVEADLAA